MSEETKELVSQLEKADQAYYNTGEPTLTDGEYDQLKEELKEKDPKNPYLLNIGAAPTGERVKHTTPVGSQLKLKDRKEYDRWIKQVLDCETPETPFVIQHKLDGLTIVLYYQEGILQQAVTRGNGFEGEDITANVVLMQNVKARLPIPFTGSLRGEMLLHKDIFETKFKPLGYKNPRNTVSGLSRDQKQTGLQKNFIVYYFDVTNGTKLQLESSKLEYIQEKLSLTTVYNFLEGNPEELWNKYLEIAKERESLPYEIDGVIVRANSLATQETMGIDGDLRPKGQRCIKFESLGGTTKLIDVELSVGHTGAIIPTGKLEPIEVGGVTIKSVLLNNYEEIERLEIAVNDEVRVIRSGDVIPKVIALVKRGTDRQPIAIPTNCPSCDSTLVKDGAHLFCQNEECQGRAFRRLKTWIVKREIKFIGDELLAELFQNRGIKEPQDLYSLTEEKLAQMPRGNGIVGTLSKQIMAEIEKSKDCPLAELVGSLCIKFLGRRQAEILMENGITTLDKFLDLDVETLVTIPGFSAEGSKATEIVAGIGATKDIVQSLLDAGVRVAQPKAQPKSEGGILEGKVFVFTGAIERVDSGGKRFTRGMMSELVQQNGGSVSSEVKKGVTHLVQADPSSQSNKTKKATKLGIEIISEKTFFEWIKM